MFASTCRGDVGRVGTPTRKPGARQTAAGPRGDGRRVPAIDVDARFLDGADVGVELLAPWGESDETLIDFVREYYLDVTHDPAAANAAAEKFIAENGDVLPGERPQNWGFSMEPGAFSGQAGGRESTRADRLPRQRGGVTFLAIKLVDQADRRAGWPCRGLPPRRTPDPDEPPTVEVVEPGVVWRCRGDDATTWTRMGLPSTRRLRADRPRRRSRQDRSPTSASSGRPTAATCSRTKIRSSARASSSSRDALR